MSKNKLNMNVIESHNHNGISKSSIPSVKNPGIEDFQFLTMYSNWMKSIKNHKFNNMLKNESAFAKNMYICLTKLIPTVNKESDKIFKKHRNKRNEFKRKGFEHCHIIKDKEKVELIYSICDEIHGNSFENVTKDDCDYDWYQLGVSGSIRIIGIYSSINNKFYPLFVDWNHLIYPDKKHNQLDYSHFEFNPYNKYK